MASPPRPGGFTLLEMLVVTTVIAIVTGMAVLSLRLVSASDSAAGDARKLQRDLSLARELAELEQRSVGLQVSHEGYRFWVYSPRTRAWRPFEERQLPGGRWSTGVAVELAVDGRNIIIKESPDTQPQLGIEPNGEFTAFDIRLSQSGKPGVWRLLPAVDGRLALEGPSQ